MDGSRLSVELLEAGTADDHTLVEALTALINRVYAVGEAGLWKDGRERTTAEETAADVRAGEVAVARLGRHIVGCVHVFLLEDGRVGELGLLAADPEHRGIGVGRALVEFAEETNRRRGADTLQLQLLVPTAWEHPVKRFLLDWYTRRGYVVVDRRPFADVYPSAGPWLCTPCLLLLMQKLANPQATARGGAAPETRARMRLVRPDDGSV
jgi:GNAT superfamily N-acetyltransferase